MKSFILWISKKRWRSSLSHALLTLPMFVAVYALSEFLGVISPATFSAAFIVGWWWSREKTQHEYKMKGAGRTYMTWHKGWIPLEWDAYSILDLLLPALTVLALAAVSHYVF